MSDFKDKLEAPFDPSQVHWRVGSTNARRNNGNATKGIPLAYVDARDCMERLDDAVGFENWQTRYTLSDGGLLICEVGLRIDGEWMWRANGAGDTQVEAEKGKCSDAFKRACVMWGVARYLYDLPNAWIDLDNGRIPKDMQKQLTDRLAAWQEKYFQRRAA